MNRALATVDTIAEIKPIPDADAIEAVRVRGWWVVAKKGEFKPGDPCVYFEIDSMLDVERPQFAFLAPRGVRTDAEGRKGHRLRTAKLRGQLSQGLVLPVLAFPELLTPTIRTGHDVTDLLGVWKWEAPVPADISGEVYGGLPHFVPKTDEERIQNCYREVAQLNAEHWLDAPGWHVTEKIDGTSMTVYFDYTEADRLYGRQTVFGVCGRNYDIKPSDKNTLWRLARELDLHDRLNAEFLFARTVVLQGEAFGEGIQGNPLRIKGQRFAPFRLIVDGKDVDLPVWPQWLRSIAVPAYAEGLVDFPSSVEDALDRAECKSLINPDRLAEGQVWSVTIDGRRHSFKAISDLYLLKQKD